MINLCRDEDYRRALLGADLAIADSGFMVLLWKLFTGESVPRISGLEHVKRLLEHESVRPPGAVVWVVATESSREKLLEFLGGTRTACPPWRVASVDRRTARQRTEGGGQRTEDGGRRTEVRGRRGRGRRTEARTEDRGRRFDALGPPRFRYRRGTPSMSLTPIAPFSCQCFRFSAFGNRLRRAQVRSPGGRRSRFSHSLGKSTRNTS